MACFALILLLLLSLPPTFKTGSLRYHGPGWKLLHRLGKGFRNPYQEHMRQNLPQDQLGDDCQSSFDLYLILDKSGSVAKNWIYIYSFAEGLVKKFTNPNMRLSIITYSTEADVVLPLTSDRNEIHKSLLLLKNIEPQGLTHMQKGLIKANEQIQKSAARGHRAVSVIVALTDGLLLLKPYLDTMEEAKKARKLGAIIYTVGVFMYSKQQLVNIANNPNNNFGVDGGFAALDSVIDPLVSKSCAEVVARQPTYMCAKDAYQVNISGHEFDSISNVKQVTCRFTFSDSKVVDETPSDVSENSITCPGPSIQHEGEDISLQVSLNGGTSFIGKKIIITNTNCWSPRPQGGTTKDTIIEPRIKDPDQVSTTSKQKAQSRPAFKWSWLLFLPALLVTLLLLCCTWKLCIKPKEKPPLPPQQSEKEPEEESPPPTSPPAPDPVPAPSTSAPSPVPLPVNTNPTVIVACCGCGNRGVQENLDTCCNYFHPSCHQMPLVWCHPKAQGGYPSFTVMKPNCSQASCSQKFCLCSSRDCFHLEEPSYPTRIVLQPKEEYFNGPRARYSSKIRFQTNQESPPATQSMYSKMCPPPKQEGYAFKSPQPPRPTRYTKSLSRMLPLLSPYTRQSVDSFSHTYPYPPISKGPKF
ncbi:anthrax toxin receptor-like isoform X1 [Rattus norvegicus]|uniref:ANTXR like 1 n=2 Tax=Rattus norvegicus TaxID=10116 RepID=A0A0G2K7L7_RAT|nr:anthrax toxin receptor-like isoform X1 [Rattus norvegicus]